MGVHQMEKEGLVSYEEKIAGRTKAYKSGNRVYQRRSGKVWHREKADHKDNAFSRGSIDEVKGACQRP